MDKLGVGVIDSHPLARSDKLGVPDDKLHWLWALFENLEVDVAKAMCPPDFNWKSLHPEEDITVLQSIIKLFVAANPQFVKQSALDLASWMIAQGADPTLRAPETCKCIHQWFMNDENQEMKVQIRYAGKSAITTALSIREQMQYLVDEKGPDIARCEDDIEWLGKLLAAMAQLHSPSLRRVRISVDSSIVDMWESMCNDEATQDIRLRAADGTVSAHSAVLAKASPVLAAMLRSGMSEDRRRCIELEDVSSAAIKLLMELVYTGATSCELSHEPALAALDLAHRWQMHSAVAMLETILQEVLSVDNFGMVASEAKLRNLDKLMAACKRFCAGSKVLQQKLQACELPGPALELMGGESSESSQPRAKKRRTW